MKNNQKDRNHQPHQNQQPQQRVPTGLAELMNNLTLLGADIKINDGEEIAIPRDEYDELMYCSVLLDILERLHKTGGKYAVADLLDNIFSDAEKIEKEDK